MSCALLLAACASAPSEPVPAAVAAQNAVDEALYEGVFVAPGADFSGYRRLMVAELDLESALTVELGSAGYDPASWAMTEADQRYYRQLYSEMMVYQLVVQGPYQTSIDPAADVLLIAARVTQVPPSTRTPAQGAALPTGSLTIDFELYDARSQRLLAVITDRRPFGQSGQMNNRQVSYHHVQQIFGYWVALLHVELDRLIGQP